MHDGKNESLKIFKHKTYRRTDRWPQSRRFRGRKEKPLKWRPKWQNGKKEKEKDENKEKNNKKVRKRRIPDQRSKGFGWDCLINVLY